MRTSPDVRSWSRRFLVLADPNRLTLLLLIHRAGPIRVHDLVRATGRSQGAVVQTLRLLRDHGAVAGRRSEGAAWYVVADQALSTLLAQIAVDDDAVRDGLTTVARLRSSEPATGPDVRPAAGSAGVEDRPGRVPRASYGSMTDVNE